MLISEDVDAHISEDVGSLNTSENVDVHIPDDVGRLDISKEGELSDIVNQEVSETLDQSSDEHPQTEVVGPPLFESLTPDQLLTEDVPEPSTQLLLHHLTRGIPKCTYEPKISSNVKYIMNHYVSDHCFNMRRFSRA